MSEPTPEAKKKRSPSKLDQLRDAERRLREAELALVQQKTENVRLENEQSIADLIATGEYRKRRIHDEVFANSLDVFNRTYNYVDDVNYRSIFEAVKTLGAWARMSPDPIVVRFSSPGGSIFDGFALYDQLKAIDLHRARITTVNIGWSASMAGILMQAGSHRIMAQNAQFMVHEASTVAFGKTSDIEDEAKLMRKINDRLFGILADRSLLAFEAGTAKEGLSLEQVWERAKRKDWWLDANEALFYGFVDEIGYL